MVKQFYTEGLALSAAVHLGIAMAALFGLPHLSRPAPDIPDVVPVDFVEIADVTRTDEPQPEPEPQPQPEQTLAKAEQTTPQQQVADAVPLPTEKKPEPEKIKAPEPEPKPEPPKPRIRVEPRDKPKPPSRLDVSKISAVIDRSIKDDAPAQTPKDETPPEKTEEPPQQQMTLADKTATATMQEAIKQKVQECWYLPGGAKDLADMRVRIRIQLREDGKLMRPPQFLDPGDMTGPGREFYRSFAESARRAVQNCEPYDNLPLAQYEIWRQIDFTFDPTEMLGG